MTRDCSKGGQCRMAHELANSACSEAGGGRQGSKRSCKFGWCFVNPTSATRQPADRRCVPVLGFKCEKLRQEVVAITQARWYMGRREETLSYEVDVGKPGAAERSALPAQGLVMLSSNGERYI